MYIGPARFRSASCRARRARRGGTWPEPCLRCGVVAGEWIRVCYDDTYNGDDVNRFARAVCRAAGKPWRNAVTMAEPSLFHL